MCPDDYSEILLSLCPSETEIFSLLSCNTDVSFSHWRNWSQQKFNVLFKTDLNDWLIIEIVYNRFGSVFKQKHEMVLMACSV